MQDKQNATTLQSELAKFKFYSPLKGLIFFEILKEIDSFSSFFFTHWMPKFWKLKDMWQDFSD